MSYGVSPSVRFRDLPAAIDFYATKLGFTIERGTAEEGNIAVSFGESRMMLESVKGFYSPAYNEAIAKRLGTPSANALYIEATDLDALYARTLANGTLIIDPLAPRDWGQSEFTVEDPEGNWLTFWKVLP